MRKNILLIEDEKTIIRPLKFFLNKEGFSLSVAEDGSEALAMAKDNNPDLILLDIVLPKINGFQVLKGLRADTKFKNTPIIILSNLARIGEMELGLKEGANDYLIKTELSLSTLLKKIREYI
jgi:DNA-binding response OmpR family regulator